MATYKLIIDTRRSKGLLFIENNISDNQFRTLSTAAAEIAEREATKGYIMTNDQNSGFCIFDITTILGDMMCENNSFFDFIKNTVDKPERYVNVKIRLDEYFAAEDFSIQTSTQIMGRHNAAFGQIGNNGYTEFICSNLQQVAFSILYCLILNDYKFAYCKHCGRLFATKTLKTVYCNRNSLYSGYEQYSCKDAVKHIIDSLEKRRKAVYERLRLRAAEYGYHSKHGKVLLTFQNRCDDYKAQIKKNASVDNLLKYSDYLMNGEGLPKKYERIKETML